MENVLFSPEGTTFITDEVDLLSSQLLNTSENQCFQRLRSLKLDLLILIQHLGIISIKICCFKKQKDIFSLLILTNELTHLLWIIVLVVT